MFSKYSFLTFLFSFLLNIQYILKFYASIIKPYSSMDGARAKTDELAYFLFLMYGSKPNQRS